MLPLEVLGHTDYVICNLLLQDDEVPATLKLYTNPINAIWNVFVQTAGYIDAEVFYAPYLLYPVLTAIMYIIFTFAMPILFNSFLVSTM